MIKFTSAVERHSFFTVSHRSLSARATVKNLSRDAHSLSNFKEQRQLFFFFFLRGGGLHLKFIYGGTSILLEKGYNLDMLPDQRLVGPIYTQLKCIFVLVGILST